MSTESVSALKRKGTPPPSEGDDRKKVSRACDSCKAKKTHCSGNRPCHRCARLHTLCEYTASYTRGRAPTPPCEPLGDQIDKSLTSTLNPISWANSANSANQDQPILCAETLSTHQSSDPATFRTSSPNSPEPSSATDFEGHYLGPTAGVTFLNRAWKRLNQAYVSTIPSDLNGESSSTSSVFTFGDRPFPQTSESAFQWPSRQHAETLVSRFFDFAVPTYRFLHRGTVQGWVTKLYLGNDDEDCFRRVSPGKAATVLMIFASASLYNVDSNGDLHNNGQNTSGVSEPFFIAAQQRLAAEKGPPRLESVQARLQQCLYLLGSSRANQAWYTFGTANLLIMALGLHRKRHNNDMERSGRYIDNESRKRVFWSAYTLDRYLSVMLGRPRVFQNEDIDQDLPDQVNDEDMTPTGVIVKRKRNDCLMDAPVLHAKLAHIIGETSKEVYTIQPVPEHDRIEAVHRKTKDLQEWKKDLPPVLDSVHASSLIPIFQRQSTVLRLAYAHAIIHANRPLLLSNLADLTRLPNYKHQKYKGDIDLCISEAKVVVDLVNSFVEDGMMFEAFWFTQYISFCAVAVLYIYTIQQYQLRSLSSETGHPTPTEAGDENYFDLAERCQRHLAEATRKNSPSKRYSIILEELRLEVHRQSQAEMIYPAAVPTGENWQCHIGTMQQDQDLASLENGDNFQDVLPAEFLPPASFGNWGMSGWTQFDSWAYSRAAEDQELELWQVP